MTATSKSHRRCNDLPRVTKGTVEGDDSEHSVSHDVGRHATCGIVLTYDEDATGSYSVCQRPNGSDARGQELTDGSLDPDDTDDGVGTQYVPVPHFDMSELVVYITSDEDVDVEMESH